VDKRGDAMVPHRTGTPCDGNAVSIFALVLSVDGSGTIKTRFLVRRLPPAAVGRLEGDRRAKIVPLSLFPRPTPSFVH